MYPVAALLSPHDLSTTIGDDAEVIGNGLCNAHNRKADLSY